MAFQGHVGIHFMIIFGILLCKIFPKMAKFQLLWAKRSYISDKNFWYHLNAWYQETLKSDGVRLNSNFVQTSRKWEMMFGLYNHLYRVWRVCPSSFVPSAITHSFLTWFSNVGRLVGWSVGWSVHTFDFLYYISILLYVMMYYDVIWCFMMYYDVLWCTMM